MSSYLTPYNISDFYDHVLRGEPRRQRRNSDDDSGGSSGGGGDATVPTRSHRQFREYVVRPNELNSETRAMVKNLLRNPAAFPVAMNFSARFLDRTYKCMDNDPDEDLQREQNPWVDLASNPNEDAVGLMRFYTNCCQSSNKYMGFVLETLCSNPSKHAMEFLRALRSLHPAFLVPPLCRQLCKNPNPEAVEWVREVLEDEEKEEDDYVDYEALSATPAGLSMLLRTGREHKVSWKHACSNPSREAVDAVMQQNLSDEYARLLAGNPFAYELFLNNDICAATYIAELCGNPHDDILTLLLRPYNDSDLDLDWKRLSGNANPRVLEFLFWEHPKKIDFMALSANTNPDAILLLQEHPTYFEAALSSTDEIQRSDTRTNNMMDEIQTNTEAHITIDDDADDESDDA